MEPSDTQRNTSEEVAALRAELEVAHRLAGRLREEAIAAERAKNEFLANISHEIRTPMNAILGFCRMLLKEPLAPAHIEKLEYVHDAAESLLELMSNVLNYSRLAAGELKLAKTPFELDAVVRDVMVATRDPARHKGLTIDYLVEDSVPYWLLGDGRRLGQVLGNLVSNALKFTEQGEIHVRVSLDEANDRTAIIRFVITDTGVGIPAERQQVIFDAFAQADGSSTRRFGGLGLGLSICRQLVDLMGGQIGFRSTQGSGTSFWVAVPLQVYSGSRAVPPASPGHARRTGQFGLPKGEASRGVDKEDHQGRFRVLAADDDYLSRTLVEMLLGRAGCLIDTATNGREAVILATQSKYDLVLMDLQMPELDGLSAIRQMRGVATGMNRTTPVIALTAHDTPDDCEHCLEAGADEYLTKPFSPDALLAVVARFLPGCLEVFEDRAENRAVGPRPDPPHLLQEYFRAICRALGDRDFERMEASAGQLKNVSLGVGEGPLADHAMRVQFAARSSDLEEATNAVERLQGLLESPCLENSSETRLTGERL